jgi:hypothetical protein
MTSTGIYRSIVVELERQRHARGYSMDVMSELMGVAERSYAKMVHPDTASGRQASWDKLQKAVDVLFCEGFEVVIRKGGVAVEMGPGTKRLIRHSAAHFDSRTQRELMREIGLKGAANGGNMRARKLSRCPPAQGDCKKGWIGERRRAIAKAEIRAPWPRNRTRF